MADTAPAFLLPEEIDRRVPLSPTTRWREEKKGRFPKRVQISSKRVAYRAAEILDWERDPADWARRHQPAVSGGDGELL
jgi:predicted DNA-binding transcriptional regulator AlpA